MEHTHDRDCLQWHPSFGDKVRCLKTPVGNMGWAVVGRLATREEAAYAHAFRFFYDDGPWLMRNNVTVVPFDFSLTVR